MLRLSCCILTASAWLLAPSVASAQADLPQKPVAKASSKGGVEVPPLPRGNLAERVAGKSTLEGVQGSGGQGGLDLPDAISKPGLPKAGAAPAAPTGIGATPAPLASPPIAAGAAGTAASTAPASAPATTEPTALARFVLDEVRKVKDPSHSILTHAVQSLVAMGDPGLAAARTALAQEHGPLVIVGERTLLTAGTDADRASVVRRLRARLPAEVCALAIDDLIELDPVSASPRLLAELLAHPQAGVRAAAQRHLVSQRSSALLEPLSIALRADLADSRLRAVQVLEGIDSPAVMGLLLERLDDRSPQVAGRAIESLAGLDDPRLDSELLRRAFGLQWVLRQQSLALIVLMDREDRGSRAVLSEMYVEPLLEGLASSDAFVAGSCASALAGIGFRSEATSELPWLDRDVPHRLVRIVGGEDFIEEFTVLQPVVTRRLALITGRNFGSDGPAWIAWWTLAAPDFLARRAVLPVRPEDAPRLRLSYVSSVGEPQSFRLLGPEVGPAFEAPTDPLAHDDSGLAETYCLSKAQSNELFERCQSEGLFSAARLPGPRGDPSLGGGARTLDVALGVRAKSFRFGASAEPWFEGVAEAALALRERNRWQRFFDGARSTSNDAWQAESAWWDASRTELERERRLKDLVLTALPKRSRSSRDEGLDELARLASIDGVLGVLDFRAVVGLLKEETFLGPRARTLIALAKRCAAVEGGASGALEPELAGDLLQAVLASFGASAAEELSSLLRASGREATRAAAASETAFLRGVAAATLARGASDGTPPDARDLEILSQLLRDPVPEVEAAAVLALGENRVESARTELLVRARLGAKPVRCAALVAVGKLGGGDVRDALLIGLADRDLDVATAAARGLALTRDPAAAPLFVSLLARDRDQNVFQAARDGLASLGPAAWDELLRVAHSPTHAAKREAALLLSEQGVPEAASLLMTHLTQNPGDAGVAVELAVLTGTDFRQEANPASAWWKWWELVVHDDSLAWWCGSLARLGIQVPDPALLKGEGSHEGARFLLQMLERDEAYIVERARRELARLLQQDVGATPLPGRERSEWVARLSTLVEQRWK